MILLIDFLLTVIIIKNLINMNNPDMRIELTPSKNSFLNVYIANFNNWFLTLKKGLYEMRTYHKQRDKDIETLRQTDTDMIQDDRIIAKYLTVDLITVMTIDACQDKNREVVPQ